MASCQESPTYRNDNPISVRRLTGVRVQPSPSKYRSRSRSAKKKTPAKKPSKSKSPARSQKKPISKTPTHTSQSRSRSTSRSRKANTAPASVRRRSRSRSKAKQGTPKVAVKRAHSKSPPKHIPLLKQLTAPRRAAPSYVPPSSRSRNAGGVCSKITGGVRSVLGNNIVATRLRRAYNRPSGQKARKHFRLHWKHYVLTALAVFLAIAVYKFSNEIVTNLRQISKSVSEYAQYQYDNKRKIFGDYLEQAQEALDEAKRRYLNNDDSPETTRSRPSSTPPAQVPIDRPNDSKQAIHREPPPPHVDDELR